MNNSSKRKKNAHLDKTKSRKKKGDTNEKPAKKKVAEYINCLQELHRLQGVLLKDLKKEVG